MTRKLILTALFLCLATFGVIRLYYNLTDDFRISNISYQMPSRSEYNFELSPAQKQIVDNALAQKYHYIGKGAQVYAFASEEGNTVIKFFKFKH